MKEKDYQNTFVRHVLEANADIPSELHDVMNPIGKIDVNKVMEVYADDYKYRMLEAMKSNFESIWMVLGDEEFKAQVFDYIKAYPSTAFDLNSYGENFGAFLKKKAHIVEEMPFIFDLASFEILFWSIFHSLNPAADPKLESVDLGQDEFLKAYFHFSPNIAIAEFEYNVFPLFQYKTKTLDHFLEENSPDIVMKEAYYLLYKKDFKVFCEPLSKNQLDFLRTLREKAKIEDALKLTSATPSEIESLFKTIAQNFLPNISCKP